MNDIGSPRHITPNTPIPWIQKPVPLKCNGRTRKACKDLTQKEKDTYNNALLLSMSNGAFQHFYQMYHYLLDKEIHKSCAFFFWHRKFLLGFENMLRSLGSQYACVTIPYYDYVQDSVMFRSRQCNSIASCSPFARELATSSAFAGKFDRTNWAYIPLALEMSHLSIQTYLFPSNTATRVAKVSSNIEYEVHNMVHNQLSSDMAMTFSPRDPIFYSHHATVDLLHTIYYQCQARDLPATDDHLHRLAAMIARPMDDAKSITIGKALVSYSVNQLPKSLTLVSLLVSVVPSLSCQPLNVS